MSQVELAQALCVTKQSISNWENDNIQPSVDDAFWDVPYTGGLALPALAVDSPERGSFFCRGIGREHSIKSTIMVL